MTTPPQQQQQRNGGLDPRRWHQQLRAERDDLPLLEDSFMSTRAKEERTKLRARARAFRADPVTELAYIEELRAFVAAEIPSLHSPEPWTRTQFLAIDGVYQRFLKDSNWRCWLEGCSRVVERFGQHCAEHLEYGADMSPVDWDCLGA